MQSAMQGLVSRGSVPTVRPGDSYRRTMRELKGKPNSTFLCSNVGNAAWFHEVILEDAAKIDITTRFNSFGLYQKPLVEALERDLLVSARIVFHDVADTRDIKLDSRLMAHVGSGRLEVYAFSGKGNLDDLIAVESQVGTHHMRFESGTATDKALAGGLGVLHATDAVAKMQGYFERLRTLSKRILAP